MLLKNISPVKKAKEDNILKSIYEAIDVKKNIIFNSGAGSGKTYALIQCLKYIINKYSNNLKYHNQRIICITYTNVAANEVKKRLGNSSTVLVSTIHERIWDLIGNYKKELVKIHKENLLQQIEILKGQVCTANEYRKYNELSDEQKVNFGKLINDSKEIYYKYYSCSASQFKKKLNCFEVSFPGILSNVANFKKIVNTLFKIDKYLICIENIDSKKSKFTSIKYDPMYNNDQLNRMRISHDTLLEYGFKIIKQYDLLKQILIDKYPYILIDEYQDTDEKVVRIMNCLHQHSIKIGHEIFVGYFGDSTQNIYKGGVGKRIFDIHNDLLQINKVYNRRSAKEIIEVANNIRNDEIIQESIYEDCYGGSIKFYYGNKDDIKSFIEKYLAEWNIRKDNPLHCLALTNKSVAKYSGFENLYDTLSNTEIYSGLGRDQLNTELLSNDISKLGEVPSMFHRIMKFIVNIENSKTQLKDILPLEIYDISIKGLRELIKTLKEIKGNTLEEYIKFMLEIYNRDGNLHYRVLVENIFDLKNITMESLYNYFLEKLYPNLIDGQEDNAKKIIKSILNINIDEYKLWYKYIVNEFDDRIIYHTYHGTKGLEFNNVIILMENAFGRTNDYFNFFFKTCKKTDTLNEKEKLKFEEIKNLLYVSVSRAIINLRILYVDDISEFKDGIKYIFNEAYVYNDLDK